MLENLFPEKTAVDVCIDFCGGDALVAQHCLDGTQVGAPFQKMGGKGVAEGMGTDGFGDACSLSIEFDVVEDRNAGEVLPASVADEDIVLLAALGRNRIAVDEPEAKFLDGSGRDGDEALLASLTHDAQKSILQKEVGKQKVAEFAYAETAAVEHFDGSFVSLSFRLTEVDGCQQGIDFFERQYLRQVLANLGGFKQNCGVFVDVAVEQEKMVERPQAGENAGDGAGTDAQFVEGPGILVKVLQADLLGIQMVVFQVFQKAFCIAGISLPRVGGKSAFQKNMGPKFVQHKAKILIIG